MNNKVLLGLFLITFFLSACLQAELPATGNVDKMITKEEALSQTFDSITPGYGMQVAIRSDVGGDPSNIMDLLDQRAANFLECQFMMGPEIGAQEFQIPSGDVIQSLSKLRVFVVPFTFGCDAVDKTVCAGIYYSDSDLLIIAKEGLGNCGKLPLWKHELGHRYGMAPDHSNKNEFEPCIDPPACFDLIDLPD